jgi:chromosome segregation ATPase
MVPHQAVGNTDPDLQATFDDPEHLSKVPGSWEELQQREAERLRKTSISSNSSSSQQMELAGAGATAIGTPKRKNTKKHKQQTTRASKAEDNDSSSTSVEDMEEDEKTQTVVRKVVLAPTSKRFTDIEAQIQQLHSTINGLTQWLEQQLHTGQQERDSIQKAVSALAADCRNSHIRLESHEDGINNLQQHTGMMQTRIEDVEHKINYNTKRLIDVVDSVSTLQDNYTSLQQNMDSIIKEFQHVKTRAAGDTAEDTCETGVFISGIQEIMKSYNMDPRSDPVAVAGRLLKEIECFHAINRIYVADRSAVNRGKRHEARAVIVYLNSTFYKRQTTIFLMYSLLKNPHVPSPSTVMQRTRDRTSQ